MKAKSRLTAITRHIIMLFVFSSNHLYKIIEFIIIIAYIQYSIAQIYVIITNAIQMHYFLSFSYTPSYMYVYNQYNIHILNSSSSDGCRRFISFAFSFEIVETYAAHIWVDGRRKKNRCIFLQLKLQQWHTHGTNTHVRIHGAQLHSTLISLLCVAIFILFYCFLLSLLYFVFVHIVQCITTAKWAHTFIWLLIKKKKHTDSWLLIIRNHRCNSEKKLRTTNSTSERKKTHT